MKGIVMKNANVVADLIETIRTTAAARGLTLHRYQANKGKFSTTITYALHSSADRPAYSRDCDGARVSLTQREGTTERCEAYRKLSNLLAKINH